MSRIKNYGLIIIRGFSDQQKKKVLAISIGFHYSSQYTIYGPAIVEAVKLEHAANSPRVLVQPEITQNIELIKIGLFYHQLEKMEDELIFLNYLWKIFYIEKESSISIIMSHRDAVLKGLEKYKDNSRVLEKYIWLKNYHNHIIAYLNFRDPSMGIN